MAATGGKGSESFLHLEDQKLGRKEITKLYDHTGTIINDTDSILKQMHLFYQELYDRKESSLLDEKQQFIEQLSLPKVSEHFIFSIEITADKVLDAIK